MACADDETAMSPTPTTMRCEKILSTVGEPLTNHYFRRFDNKVQLKNLFGLEKAANLGLGGLGGVRGVNDIAGLIFTHVTADSSLEREL